MNTEVTLNGYAYSPINSAWGTIGPVQVTFDFTTTSDGGYSHYAAVTDFSIMLNHSPYIRMDSLAGQYIFSPAQTFFAAYTPNGSFIFEWIGGQGGFRDSEQQINMQFYHTSVTDQTPVPEPGLLALWLAMLVCAGFFWKREHHAG
jgi:hypothetical protein